MATLKTIVSWFSYLLHCLLALLLLGLTGISLASGSPALHLEMLPRSGSSLEYILLGGALFDFLSIVLAVMGRWRILFLLWTLVVAALVTKGYIFSSYRFEPGELRHAAYLIAAAWVGVAGAWFRLRAQPNCGPRKYIVK